MSPPPVATSHNMVAPPVRELLSSAIVGAYLAGAALGGGWAFALLYFGHVYDSHISIALLAAALCWLVYLLRVWWPVWRRHRMRPARMMSPSQSARAWKTVAMLAIFVAASIGLASTWWDDNGYAIGGVGAVGLAIILRTWRDSIISAVDGRSVLDERGEVQVSCPACGYSLIGLTSLRCPECGASFTLDEIIRAQHFKKPHMEGDAVSHG